MREITCDVVQDLLPLYVDGCCTVGSRQMVEAHTAQCPACQQLLQEMTCQLPVTDSPKEELAGGHSIPLKNGLKKIRNRWVASLILALLLIPACLLGWGQITGRGICFTNLHEIAIGNAFLRQLQRGNYERAYRYVDAEQVKERWLEEWFDVETLVNFEEDGREHFREAASLLMEAGGIEEYHYLAVTRTGSAYQLIYTVLIAGEEQEMILDIGDGGIISIIGRGSYTEDPISHLGMWSESLWQDYEGCRFDPETGEYVYHNGD